MSKIPLRGEVWQRKNKKYHIRGINTNRDCVYIISETGYDMCIEDINDFSNEFEYVGIAEADFEDLFKTEN